jgi:dTDP-4-dehydrorhamnose 3,5-epimerase
MTKHKPSLISRPAPHIDSRGTFLRVLDTSESIIDVRQVNASISFGKGTTRGMHFLLGKHSENKIVSVLHGVIQDIVVCVDTESKDYGEALSFTLQPGAESLFIPKGYAHGFQVHSDLAVVSYNVDKKYAAEADAGISPYSPLLRDLWEHPIGKISEKDKNLPFFPAKNSFEKCPCC